MAIDARAGTLISPSDVLDIGKLIEAFFHKKPDVSIAAQRVSFGTSGHRGCAFDTSFNENHIVAIVQAVCAYRKAHGIDGPLFVGRDTHAVSEPAFQVTLEVLAANGVTTMIDHKNSVTPTPVVSRAIIDHNIGRTGGFADGIIITPSHNPPEDGGIKYNPPHGGPAETEITAWIESFANKLLQDGLKDVRRLSNAQSAPGIARYDFLNKYIEQLNDIVDLDVVRSAGLRIGVDPLGGAAVHYWAPLAERFKLNLTVTDSTVDPTFRTIPRDWDGKIRMDCSSKYPMQRLLAIKDRFDIAFANDTDADRHGIVDADGLMEPNSYLATCARYLGKRRDGFSARKIGKTIVSSSIIDRVATGLGTSIMEVPVGFKWFVDGLTRGQIFFCGEESAGSSYLRRNGKVWTTDKDGLIAGLLAAEMTAREGKPPSKQFAEITQTAGRTYYARIDSPADKPLRDKIAAVTTDSIKQTSLAGAPITRKETTASGNGAKIGGIKLSTDKGWIAMRPSGTEDIYKIYAESFVDADHLSKLQKEAAQIMTGLK
jgi:phosphoglucomutase